MPKALTIEALCARHHNEDVHTRYVARVALTIFDAVRRRAGLRLADRSLLEAAARLHDIGFAGRPGDHVRAGADLVRRTGVAGIPRGKLPALAALIRLHRGSAVGLLRDPGLKRLADRNRLLKLGAILRVADALDHGHVQNVVLKSVKCAEQRITITVRSCGFAGHIESVREKADLWRRMMPGELVLRAASTPAGPVGLPGLPKNTAAVELVRRLLCVQYRAVVDHAQAARTDNDPIHLHDIRVGFRRFRAILRLFRPILSTSSAGRLDVALGDLNRRLGPIRDEDVWLTFVESTAIPLAVRKQAAWPAYRVRQRRRAGLARARMRAILKQASTRRLLADLRYLLRVELPVMAAEQKLTAAPYLRRKLNRALGRIVAHDPLADLRDVQALHTFRRVCRRCRYIAEFSVPVLGKPAAGAAKRMKRLADALGRVHDLDMAMDRLAADAAAPPALRNTLSRRRVAAVRKFVILWREMQKKGSLERAIARLAE